MIFDAIGTKWEIELFNCTNERAILKKVKNRIEEFDKNYSRFRADSIVTKMSKNRGTYTLPEDAKKLLDMYRKLYDLSGGQMTPLIGGTLSDAGYDSTYSFKPKLLTKTPSWDDCIDFKFPKLVIKMPVLLDFGACGKGYLVDIIGELIQGEGCTAFVINAGGDILHKGYENIDVALEHPNNFEQAIGIASVNNQALCGSAGNRRKWATYNHILNPKTLASPTHINAVWVCASNALLADALTTALYFVSAKTLLEKYNFSYALIRKDLSLVYTKDFPAKFFK